jgi:hypothetical protein
VIARDCRPRHGCFVVAAVLAPYRFQNSRLSISKPHSGLFLDPALIELILIG